VTELPLNIDVLRRYSRQQRQEITSRLRKSARESSDQAFTRTARGLRTSIDDETALTWGPKVTAAKDMSLTPEEAERAGANNCGLRQNSARITTQPQLRSIRRKSRSRTAADTTKRSVEKHGISEEVIASIGAQLRDCRIFVSDDVVRSIADGARVRHGGHLLAADDGRLREVKAWRAGEQDKSTSEYMVVYGLVTRWRKVFKRKNKR
jgi:hypothetical protein